MCARLKVLVDGESIVAVRSGDSYAERMPGRCNRIDVCAEVGRQSPRDPLGRDTDVVRNAMDLALLRKVLHNCLRADADHGLHDKNLWRLDIASINSATRIRIAAKCILH